MTFYKKFGEMNVLEAETRALRYGVEICSTNALSRIEAEVDS